MLDGGEVDSEVARRLAALGRREQVPGFRAGRAPAAVLARRFGERVRREVEGRLSEKALREVLARQELWPMSAPALERLESEDGSPFPRFAAAFHAFPRLPEIDLSRLRIARPVPTVTGEDIDEMLARLVEHREPAPPELDAAFVRALGVAEGTVAALRERLRRTMEEELAEAVEAEVALRVERALLAAHPDLEVPKDLPQAETEEMRAACLYFEIARQNGIRPTAGAVLARIEEEARDTDDPQVATDRILADGNLYREIEEEVLRRQVVAFVLDRAEVVDEPATFVDFVRPREWASREQE